MENHRFRSRSHSPPRGTQIEGPLVSSKEWVKRVKKVVAGVVGQIDAYEIILTFDSNFPPTNLIKGLREAVRGLQGSEKQFPAPFGKEKAKDEMQKVNEEIEEKKKAEHVEEEAVQSTEDQDQMKNLLNEICQHSRVTAQNKMSKNSTSERMLRKKPENTVTQPQKPKVPTGKKKYSAASNGRGGGHSICQRPLLEITLSQVQTMKKTSLEKKVQFEFQNITDLSLKLETCEKGNEIWLKVSDKVELKDLQQFVQKFANVICKVEFCADNVQGMSPSDLQQLLCGVPNLTYLYLPRVPSEWKRLDKKLDLSILLPQVQTISFRHLGLWLNVYPTLIEGLFKIMPNLKNVHRFPLSYIDMLKVDGMANLSSIKSVDIICSGLEGTERQQKLSHLASISSKTGLQMAELSLGALSKEISPDSSALKSCCKCLSTILRNNKRTLEYLRIEPFFHPQLLKYPEMKAVKKLLLISYLPSKNMDGQKPQFFGEGFDVGKTFPNLMEVTLQGSSCSLEKFMEFFPEDFSNNFKGVTSLNFDFFFYGDPKVMEKVAALFPNVKMLFMECRFRWLEIFLPHILKLWPKLRSIKLKVDVTAPEEDEKIFEKYLLDPVFTGIPAAKCNELRERKEKRDVDLKIYRENPGILAMTELEDLTLIFHNYYEHKGVQENTPLFSHVSSFYGFQCLRDLKVTCAIPWDEKNSDKIREILNPIEKLVNLNPNYYEEREPSNPDLSWP